MASFCRPCHDSRVLRGMLAPFPMGVVARARIGILGHARAEMGPLIMAFLILLAILFVFPIIFMCPFYSLFGGWDDFTIEELRKTAFISGPSKGIMILLYKVSAAFARMSKLHNRFPLADYKVVDRQLQELIDEGKANMMMKRKK